MSLTVTRSQITALARAIDIPGLSYLQRLDLIARPLGFANQAALMAALGEPPAAPEAAPTTGDSPDALSCELIDWRAFQGDDFPPAPIAAKVRLTPERADIHVGASAAGEYSGDNASSVSVEREGDVTRFMIYDSLSEAPRVFGVRDGEALRELPNDWRELRREDLEDGPEA